MESFISIDQNSHPLWDTVPKLHALVAKGIHGTHYLEDIDVAFTRRGAAPGDAALTLTPERYYRGGTSDWGATLFYTEFLGRNPLDVRDIEVYTGKTTKALARLLNTTVDGMYDRYSVSDNWQMVGTSYVDDSRDRHRVIGDLTTGETAPLIGRVLDIAESDIERSFPEAAAQKRLKEWFGVERARLDELLAALPHDAPLVTFYRQWMNTHVPGTDYGLTSDLFSIQRPENNAGPLLDVFLNEYEMAAGLYNDAIEETDVGLHKLSVNKGELPFFFVWRHDGTLFRTSASLDDGRVSAGGRSWPLEQRGKRRVLPAERMRQDAICAVAGKALLLVLQARLGEKGAPLALPYRGSSYMPAAFALERKLRAAGLLKGIVRPVCRVRINFLNSLRHSTTVVRLPDHLAEAFGRHELTAAAFADDVCDVARQAEKMLKKATSESGREKLIREITPDLDSKLDRLEARRRTLAADPATRPLASGVWDEVKDLKRQQLEAYVDFIVKQVHVADLDYFDSRGAILPWSIAVGGSEHYQRLIAHAEIYQEQQT